jgi:hypothetical protein
MLSNTLIAVAALAGSAAAHYKLLVPEWRGDSFEEPASQWVYPCASLLTHSPIPIPSLTTFPGANVNETTDIANRTQWPLTGGSIKINGSHPSALTFVNLALGSNATNFNISLADGFNQTGAGVFCLKETNRANLEDGIKKAGYSGLDDERLDGLEATVQVIQLGHAGSALYNVRFSSSIPAQCLKY